jgi:hypothetical protein
MPVYLFRQQIQTYLTTLYFARQSKSSYLWGEAREATLPETNKIYLTEQYLRSNLQRQVYCRVKKCQAMSMVFPKKVHIFDGDIHCHISPPIPRNFRPRTFPTEDTRIE